jgi:hypothetical protein
MLWLCGWDEARMIAHLDSPPADDDEVEEETEDAEYEDILERGLDMGAGEWL